MSNITIEQNNDKYRGAWKPNTRYNKDDLVSDGVALWVALADFTSGATFNVSNWFCSDCNPSPPPMNVEQGFDLSLSSISGHDYVGDAVDTIFNPTGSLLRACAMGVVSHPHTDTTLRYFEYTLLYQNGLDLPFAGYGMDEPTYELAGAGYNAAAYWAGYNNVRIRGESYTQIPGVQPRRNDVVSVWTRGTKVWFAINSELLGYATSAGADPYLDVAPTKTIGVTGDFRPVVSCYGVGAGVKLNTVGNFVYPPLSPAVPWDS